MKRTAVFGSVFYRFRHEPGVVGCGSDGKPPRDGDSSVAGGCQQPASKRFKNSR